MPEKQGKRRTANPDPSPLGQQGKPSMAKPIAAPPPELIFGEKTGDGPKLRGQMQLVHDRIGDALRKWAAENDYTIEENVTIRGPVYHASQTPASAAGDGLAGGRGDGTATPVGEKESHGFKGEN
jgi:hypothetical protein